MISLISNWFLRDGAPPALVRTLKKLADEVKAAEPDTLAYAVHIQARFPLDENLDPLKPPAKPIPNNLQRVVTFFEIYRDAKAFSDHIKGPVFQNFLKKNLKYFYEDPENPGMAYTENQNLERMSAFFRQSSNEKTPVKGKAVAKRKVAAKKTGRAKK